MVAASLVILVVGILPSLIVVDIHLLLVFVYYTVAIAYHPLVDAVDNHLASVVLLENSLVLMISVDLNLKNLQILEHLHHQLASLNLLFILGAIKISYRLTLWKLWRQIRIITHGLTLNRSARLIVHFYYF